MTTVNEETKRGDDAGWFDVQAYSTRARWEGPDLADGGLEGFETLEGAINCADSEEYEDCYEVVVTAWGVHKDHQPGESVYCRFNRPEKLDCNEPSVLAGHVAVNAHRDALKLEGGHRLQLWHLLVSLREWSAASGVDLDEVLADVDNRMRSGELNVPAAEGNLRGKEMAASQRPHQGAALTQ